MFHSVISAYLSLFFLFLSVIVLFSPTIIKPETTLFKMAAARAHRDAPCLPRIGEIATIPLPVSRLLTRSSLVSLSYSRQELLDFGSCGCNNFLGDLRLAPELVRATEHRGAGECQQSRIRFRFRLDSNCHCQCTAQRQRNAPQNEHLTPLPQPISRCSQSNFPSCCLTINSEIPQFWSLISYPSLYNIGILVKPPDMLLN